MFCSQCGTSNDNSAKFCSGCGSSLVTTKDSNVEVRTFVKSDDFYKAIIGSKSQNYYLPIFKRFDDNGKIGISWNWAAFFITFYWLLYRKMWLNALIYFLLPYLGLIPLSIIAAIAESNNSAGMAIIAGLGYLIYFLALFILPPLYANALYYKHCQKKIAETKATSNDTQRQLGELAGKGGTSNIAAILIGLVVIFAVIGVLAAISIPAYQDYVMRSRLVQAISVSHPATETVSQYVYQHQTVPNSLSEAGFTTPLPHSIKNMTIDSQNGVITVLMAEGSIKDKSLLWIPSIENEQIVWVCTSYDIPQRYLPSQCKQQQ